MTLPSGSYDASSSSGRISKPRLGRPSALRVRCHCAATVMAGQAIASRRGATARGKRRAHEFPECAPIRGGNGVAGHQHRAYERKSITAKSLGDERASELRAVFGGWPGNRERVTGCSSVEAED